MGELREGVFSSPSEAETKEIKTDKIKIELLDLIVDIVDADDFPFEDWKKEAENIDIDKVKIEYLIEFLRNTRNIVRKDYLNFKTSKNNSETFSDNKSIENNEKIKNIFGDVLAEIRMGNYPQIGDGASSRVFRSSKHPGHCFKIIKNFSEYANCNSIMTEMEYLEDIYDLEVNGIRAPRPIIAFECEDIHILTMETLDAVNVKDIINGREKLPENFDLEKSFIDLENYLKTLNEDRRIYHNDIFDRNLMIDRKKGNFYVIDFGKSERRSIDNVNNLLYSRRAQKSGDFKNLNEIKSSLREKI